MARAASAPKKEISMEEALWKSADILWRRRFNFQGTQGDNPLNR